MERDQALALIRDRRRAIAQTRASLDAEDQELAIAERVYLRLASGDVEHTEAVSTPPPKPVAQLKGQAAMIADALSRGAVWQTANDINAYIELAHGSRIVSNSLLPQLWKLNKNGIVRRDGNKVALVSRLGSEAGM